MFVKLRGLEKIPLISFQIASVSNVNLISSIFFLWYILYFMF
jgi:hypothetical protein